MKYCLLFLLATLLGSAETLDVGTAELVCDRSCGIIIEPGPNFALHVPLKADGTPDSSRSYSSGQVKFTIQYPKNATFNIVHQYSEAK